jgi:hypothetical protein
MGFEITIENFIYELNKDNIGKGRFGFVKKGIRLIDKKQVAIKFLQYNKNKEFENFLNEVILFIKKKG